MKWLKSLPTHLLVFLMLMLMALPSVALIVHAGLQGRQEDLRIATRATTYLLDNLAAELNNKVESARQMMEMLSIMPDVRQRNVAEVNQLLSTLRSRYPVYANIIIVDRDGTSWANAVPAAPKVFLADRKAFNDAKATGRFSFGEYTVGKTTRKPILNFAHPIKAADGSFAGAILCGIDLTFIGQLLHLDELPPGTSFGIFDHKGTFLYRTVGNDRFIGTKDRPENFEEMKNGPDEGTLYVTSADGIKRLAAYRKIRLTEESPPYAYLRGGTPIDVLLQEANSALVKNLLTMMMVLVLVFWLNIRLSKRLLVDRIATLQSASRRLASGDLKVRVSEEVEGGELGALGTAFDEMAAALSFELSERMRKEDTLREKSDLLELAHDAIILRQLDGTIVYWNQGACSVYGYAPEQALGNRIHELLQTVFPKPLEEIQEELLQEGRWEGRLQHKKAEGGCIVVGSRWALQYDKDGAPWRIMEINSDITERERTQDELLKMQKLESLGVLAGGIAHDFNNILTGILGNVSLVQMSLDDPERARRMLLQAEKACQRATELSCRLLTFAKGGTPVKRSVAASHVVEEVLALVLPGSNVLSVLELPDDLHHFEVDEGQIYQAFSNIVINALQSMPNGGTLTVSGRNVILQGENRMALPEGEYVEISFADTGCGIAPEDQRKIFDPYFTTKAGGKGLGLASAHSVVVRHGGYITLRSELGKGSTFFVLLPASKTSLQQAGRSAAVAAPVDCRGLRVLVMDDEDLIRQLLSEMLGTLGCRVETCTNGTEAIELYAAAMASGKPYAAVIMDLTIPGGMGGKEAAERLLAMDPAAYLIVSSGYSNDPVISDYARYGFKATIAKPYKAAEVSEVLGNVVAAD